MSLEAGPISPSVLFCVFFLFVSNASMHASDWALFFLVPFHFDL